MTTLYIRVRNALHGFIKSQSTISGYTVSKVTKVQDVNYGFWMTLTRGDETLRVYVEVQKEG